jgi:DNA-binding GntR family transcriptional regulator
MRLNRLVPFTSLIEQCGYQPSVDAQVQRVEPAAADEAEAMGVEPGTPCLVVRRLLRASGAPVITVTDVVPVERLPAPLEDVVDADTTFDFLEANRVATIDYATSEFIPRVARGTEPEGLEIEPGTPYIELLETHFTHDHERIAISRICVDDSVVRLSLLRRSL